MQVKRVVKMLSIVSASAGLSACQSFYQGSIKESFQVDPVVTRSGKPVGYFDKYRQNENIRRCWRSNTDFQPGIGRTDNETGTDYNTASDGAPICPLDLDTWEFPQHRLDAEQEEIRANKGKESKKDSNPKVEVPPKPEDQSAPSKNKEPRRSAFANVQNCEEKSAYAVTYSTPGETTRDASDSLQKAKVTLAELNAKVATAKAAAVQQQAFYDTLKAQKDVPDAARADVLEILQAAVKKNDAQAQSLAEQSKDIQLAVAQRRAALIEALRMVPADDLLADTTKTIAVLEARSAAMPKLIEGAAQSLKTKKEDLANLNNSTDKANAAKTAQAKLEVDAATEALEKLKQESQGMNATIDAQKTLKAEIKAIMESAYDTEPTLKAVAGDRLNAAKCKTLRNQLQDEILARSEMICAAHLSDMKASAASLNLNFSVGTLISSAFGAISKVASVKSGLAATAAISSGSQTAVNKEIYQQYFAPAIGNSIASRRASLLADVRAQQSKDVAAYPVARAVTEAVRFHEACSLSNGLSYLMESVSKRTDADIEKLGGLIDTLQKTLVDAEAQLSKVDETKDPQAAQSARIARNALLQELDVLRLRRLNLQRLQ